MNNSKTASLIIERLIYKVDDNIGLWVGDGAGGEFKNLLIKEEK